MREDDGMNLTEFLLARIAEDEAEAQRGLNADDGDPLRIFSWISPERAVAECEAKRRMVAEAVFWRDKRPHSPNAESFARWLLLKMATVYADHPDFRDEWRA